MHLTKGTVSLQKSNWDSSEGVVTTIWPQRHISGFDSWWVEEGFSPPKHPVFLFRGLRDSFVED